MKFLLAFILISIQLRVLGQSQVTSLDVEPSINTKASAEFALEKWTPNESLRIDYSLVRVSPGIMPMTSGNSEMTPAVIVLRILRLDKGVYVFNKSYSIPGGGTSTYAELIVWDFSEGTYRLEYYHGTNVGEHPGVRGKVWLSRTDMKGPIPKPPVPRDSLDRSPKVKYRVD